MFKVVNESGSEYVYVCQCMMNEVVCCTDMEVVAYSDVIFAPNLKLLFMLYVFNLWC